MRQPQYPTPQDNHRNCPVCGFNPCGIDCRLGLQQWDLERWEEMLAENDELLPPRKKRRRRRRRDDEDYDDGD